MKKLIEDIIEDGIVDADEIQALRKVIWEDGKVDQDEVLGVFEINDAVTGNANDAGWPTLVADVVCAYALEDDETPGVVDADEGKFLADLIKGDGQVDETEKFALRQLKEKAAGIESVELNELLATV